MAVEVEERNVRHAQSALDCRGTQLRCLVVLWRGRQRLRSSLGHILGHTWRSDNFFGFFKELVLLLFILYDDLCIFDTKRPFQSFFFLFEAYNNVVDLLTHHTEIQMISLLLQLLSFFYGNRIILIFFSDCAIDIDILVI